MIHKHYINMIFQKIYVLMNLLIKKELWPLIYVMLKMEKLQIWLNIEVSQLKVKYVVMDMHKPYINLIKNNFPNANIIIDLFHVVQLISRSFNKTKIQAMKNDKINYKKIKRYWRLLLKARIDLDSNTWKKYLCFKNLMTEVDIRTK